MAEILWTADKGWLDKPVPARLIIDEKGKWQFVPIKENDNG